MDLRLTLSTVLHAMKNRRRDWSRLRPGAEQPLRQLDEYVSTAPSPQNAVDALV